MHGLPSSHLPEEVIPGVKGWHTESGVFVLRLHYTADPERCTDEWLADQLLGYVGGKQGRDWRREMEIDFTAYAGRPVYGSFDANRCTVQAVAADLWNPYLDLWVGWDFGYRYPAVVWLQHDPTTNVLTFLHEHFPTLGFEADVGITIDVLADQVLAITDALFPPEQRGPDVQVRHFVDPAGQMHSDKSELTSVQHLAQHGIIAEWNVVGRKNRVMVARRWVEAPSSLFRISVNCPLSIEAFGGGYRYPEDKGQTGVDPEKPDTGKKAQSEPYIHLMDAFEYIVASTLADGWGDGGNLDEEIAKYTAPHDELLYGSLTEQVAALVRNRQDTPTDIMRYLDALYDEEYEEWVDAPWEMV